MQFGSQNAVLFSALPLTAQTTTLPLLKRICASLSANFLAEGAPARYAVWRVRLWLRRHRSEAAHAAEIIVE
jgi:hypothetical protein